MMGVGKSTIGKRLANKLKVNFLDVDRIIELNEKNSIQEIFQNKGELYFRKIEKKTTLEILNQKNSIIALGGGALTNKSIRKEVIKSTICIWLDVSTKNLLLRLKNIKKRPLLNQENLQDTINKIYSDRKKIYNKSHFKIKCDLLNVDQIIEKIIKINANSGN
jgi:shikimate kinase